MKAKMMVIACAILIGTWIGAYDDDTGALLWATFIVDGTNQNAIGEIVDTGNCRYKYVTRDRQNKIDWIVIHVDQCEAP